MFLFVIFIITRLTTTRCNCFLSLELYVVANILVFY